jgi:hypothetical protein
VRSMLLLTCACTNSHAQLRIGRSRVHVTRTHADARTVESRRVVGVASAIVRSARLLS